MSGEVQPDNDLLKGLKEKSLAFVTLLIDQDCRFQVYQQYGANGNATLKRALLSQMRALVSVLEEEEVAAMKKLVIPSGQSSGLFPHPSSAFAATRPQAA